MQFSLETTSEIGRRLVIDIPAEDVDARIKGRLKEVVKKAQLKGFRPGKVPLLEIKRRFGDSVRQEVLADTMRDSLSKALQEEDIDVLGTPQLEAINTELGQNFKFAASFEVYPEIKVAGLEDMSVEQPVAEVAEQDVNEVINKLRQQKPDWQSVERDAQAGDKVVLDFTGRIDGKAFAGGAAKDYSLVLGSGRFIKDLEDGLLGMQAGSDKQIDVVFPADYPHKELAAKAAQFEVKVKEVAESSLPELDEAFIKGYGVEDGSLTSFNQQVRDNMQQELKSAIDSYVKKQVTEALLAANQVPLPTALVDSERAHLKQLALRSQGAASKLTADQLPNEPFQAEAEKRAKLALLFRALIDKYGLTVDDQQVRSLVEQEARSYHDPQEMLNWYYSDAKRLDGFKSLALENQLMEKLLTEITVNEVTKSYQQVLELTRGKSLNNDDSPTTERAPENQQQSATTTG
jgi:trigger factor